MKKILILLIFAFLINLSIEEEKQLSNKIVNTFKCVLDSKKRIDDIISFIEVLFTSDNIFSLLTHLAPIDSIFKECFNISLMDIISKFINP